MITHTRSTLQSASNRTVQLDLPSVTLTVFFFPTNLGRSNKTNAAAIVLREYDTSRVLAVRLSWFNVLKRYNFVNQLSRIIGIRDAELTDTHTT